MDTRKEGQAGEPAHIVAGRGEKRPDPSACMNARICMQLAKTDAGHSACQARQLPQCMFCADASLREVGLNLAVATMRKGERCHLKVQPQYGYGDRGDCLPFPAFAICPGQTAT